MRKITNHDQFPGAPGGLPMGEWGGSEQTEGDEWSLVAMGDLGLSGSTGRWAQRPGDMLEVFGEISPAVRAADCAFANLETPVSQSWSPEMMYCGDARWLPELASAGIRVLHLASNHMLDHGPEVYRETINAVRESGICGIGGGETLAEASSLFVRTYSKMRIGWLAAGHTNLRQPASPRFWELDADEVVRATDRSRGQVDLLFVSLHWGPMAVDYPYEEQYETAHRLVDAGASAVLMHHAHVLQGVEVYHGVPICFSLGNALFDPGEGSIQKAGSFVSPVYEQMVNTAIFRLSWRNGRFTRLVVAPMCLPRPQDEHDGVAFGIRWATPEVALRVLDRLARLSDDLRGDFRPKLRAQLWRRRRFVVRTQLKLIVRNREYWRVWHLITLVRPRHVWGLVRRVLQRRCE